MICLTLFWNFLMIGTLSFGGGYGMISLVREVVLGHGLRCRSPPRGRWP